MPERSFTFRDQEAFAALSRDFNPMHVDPEAARRLPLGRPVVHGIHAVLWALEQWLAAQSEPLALARLDVQFRAPIGTGDRVALDWTEGPGDGAETRFTLAVAGRRTTEIAVVWRAATDGPPVTPPAGGAGSVAPPCAVVAEVELPSAEGTVPVALDEAARTALLGVPGRLPAWQAAVLAATSRLVGMDCPGLHSIYSRLRLAFADPGEAPRALAYRTQRYDPRFRLLRLAVEANGVEGEVEAVVRRPPVAQARMDDLAALVPRGVFAGRRVLVVGGSRGLGETAAKLMAAGGAAVRLTYATGRGDAERVAAEIAAHGGEVGTCSLDARDPDPEACARLRAWSPTDLHFFATPRIEPSPGRTFSGPLFTRLAGVYVEGFAAVFERLVHDGLARVLYPSTIFLDEHPARFAEYGVAKAAGEALCASLARRHPAIAFAMPRLPRLATDQTSADEAPAAPVLADLLLS